MPNEIRVRDLVKLRPGVYDPALARSETDVFQVRDVQPFSINIGVQAWGWGVWVKPDQVEVIASYEQVTEAEEHIEEMMKESIETAGRFLTKDSGVRVQFGTGAVRDTQAGKPRYDLIPANALKRVAELYARGAEKYDDHNWRKGIPMSRCLGSLMRHTNQFVLGDIDEDHLAAVVFNALCIMSFEEDGRDDLNDMAGYRGVANG